MFPLIPALILLLLHGPSSFDRLAETGQLPASLVAFQRDASSRAGRTLVDREQTCRRVLATLIASTGDRELSEAFRAMFRSPRPKLSPLPASLETDGSPAKISIPAEPCQSLPEGFDPGDRTRDGPKLA